MQSQATHFQTRVEIGFEDYEAGNSIFLQLNNNRNQPLDGRQVLVTVPVPEILLHKTLDLHDNIQQCTVNINKQSKIRQNR